MPVYSEKVMEHFSNPQNVGEISDADGVGQVGNPVCGDLMKVTIKVKDNRLEDIRFLTFGCGAAIAVASMVSQMAKGKTIEEALKISNKDVAEQLGGLPGNKMHCSNLGAEALHNAIDDYLKNKKQVAAETGACICPYCDQPDCPEPLKSSDPCKAPVQRRQAKN